MMKILFIYRHPSMGFSIGKVFRPFEEEMKKYAEVDSIYMPTSQYSLNSIWQNIKTTRKAINSKKYDIVHITGTEHYLIPFLLGEKVVVTVLQCRQGGNVVCLKWANCSTAPYDVVSNIVCALMPTRLYAPVLFPPVMTSPAIGSRQPVYKYRRVVQIMCQS